MSRKTPASSPSPSPANTATKLGFVAAMLSIPWTRAVLYFMVVGPILLSFGVVVFHRHQVARAQDFVEVEGVVTTSKLETSGRDRPYPKLHATYEYGGRRNWVSLTVALGIEGQGKLGAEQVIERYPVGTPIPVFVNPDDPDEAMLTRSYDPSSSIGAGILLLLALGYVIRADVRRISRAES